MAVPRILIISSEANSSAAMIRTLTSLGYQVFAAEDYAAGLDLFQVNHYAIVLIESCRPDEGIDLVAQLRARQADVACVLIADPQDVEEREVEGVRCWLPRPINLDDLIDAVEQVLCGDAFKFEKQLGKDQRVEHNIAKSDRPAWCEVCGYSTHWYHQALLRYFCSEYCLEQYQQTDS